MKFCLFSLQKTRFDSKASVAIGLFLAATYTARVEAQSHESHNSEAIPGLPAAASLSEPARPPPSPSADYEAALSEALEAHARGDYGQARIFMERAHDLEPSARTLRGLGIVAFAQGRHLDAIRYLEAALASPDKPLTAELRISVEELLAHAWGQVGRLEILVEPEGRFLVDGLAPDFYGPNTVVLPPSTHLITAQAHKRADFVLPLEIKAGERRTIQIVLARPTPPVVIERVTDAPRPSGREFWTKRKRRVAWLSGAAFVGAGAAVYGAAYARLNHVVQRCEDMADGECTSKRARQLYDSEHIAQLGITAAMLGGVGLLTWLSAAALEIWGGAKSDATPPRAKLMVGPSSVSLRSSF
ncbi:MAG: tetratricopeptide repeat protein [Myxococcales bacterium]